MADRPRRSLSEGPITGHMVRLMLPMIMGITALFTTTLVDTFWLGQLSTEALAAIAFAAPVTMAVFSISIGLGAGIASVVARAAGRGGDDRLRRLTTDAVVLALLIMATTALIGILTARPLFSLMGAEGEVLDNVVAYMRIWFVSVIFTAGPMMANNVLRALGNALAPSLIMISIAFINMILDPFLIFGWGPFPRLEVAGAALATLIANIIAFAMAFWLLVVRERLVTFARVRWAQLRSSWREILHVGIPAAGSNAINPVATAIAVASVARFGEAAVAGMGVGRQLEMFAIIPLFALSAAIGPVTGQNDGAGKPERVREAFIAAFRIAVFWGLGVSALLLVFREPLAALFIAEEGAQAARDAAGLYVILVAATTAGYGITMAASAGFNGLGRPLPGLAMTFARAAVIMAPGAWILGSLYGLTGAFAALGLANVLAGVGAVAWTLLRGATAKGPSHASPREA